MKTLFNLTTCPEDLDRFQDQADLVQYMTGFDGVELLPMGEDPTRPHPERTGMGPTYALLLQLAGSMEPGLPCPAGGIREPGNLRNLLRWNDSGSLGPTAPGRSGLGQILSGRLCGVPCCGLHHS